MKRYIDAEKLKAEIERLKYKYPSWQLKLAMDDLCDFITSLQQEQPELSGYDKALLEVKSKVDKIYEETSIGLNEYDSGLYNGIAETCMKLRGFIKARLGFDEQPEVDLDNEISRFIRTYFNKPDYEEDFIAEVDWEKSMKECARHFYELGKTASKEK